MATRDQFKLTLAERRRRTFSDTFKRDKVREIEQGLVRVSDVSKQYGVSDTAVYYWIRKFGIDKQTPERIVIESMSDTRALKDLKERLAELERLLGQKQVEVEYYKKLIDMAEDEYCISIKKNCATQPCDTSGSPEKNTPSA